MFKKIKRLALTGTFAVAMLFGIIINEAANYPPGPTVTNDNSANAGIIVNEATGEQTPTVEDIIKGNINVGSA